MIDEQGDPEIEKRLSQALELRDSGRDDWLEQACDGRPDLAAVVSRHADRAAKLPSMLGSALLLDVSVGTVVGERYELVERLRSGAMGVVYRGIDLELERGVAVKVLRTEMLDPDEATARFLREAEVMASVQHPAVVTIYDRGSTASGDLFIVMELLEGAPLNDILEEGRRLSDAVQSDAVPSNAAQPDDASWIGEQFAIAGLAGASYLRTVVGWTADLAAGLQAVHDVGVFHRDIKPSNVFVRKNGRPVLIDFGVAALESHGTLTRTGSSPGTPVYMAPESLSEGSKPRPTHDVYGIAATLYHMVTGRPPYEGSASQVLASIVARDPTPPAQVRPGLPRDLGAIIGKGMERRAPLRYHSADALENDLRAFLAYRPVAARHVTALGRSWRRLRRSRSALGAASILVLMALWLGLSELRDAHVAHRGEQLAEVLRHLPPNFTIASTANRVWLDQQDRAALAALLDRGVELSSDPIPVRLLRSSFRLDHGDPAGAAHDMAVIEEHVDTPFVRALAGRYRDLASASAIAIAIDSENATATEPEVPPTLDLTELPPAESALDVYLDAYHRMRMEDYGEARQRLGDPRLAGLAHAQELRLISTDFGGLPREEAKELAARVFAEGIRLEERLGYRTAGTAHLLGRMLSVQGRYVEALQVLREGVALAGRSSGLRINLGMMAWRLGMDDLAMEHWSVAIELQPAYYKPYRNLIWLHLDRFEFDEVERLIERTPFGDGPAAEHSRLVYRARVKTERALLALRGEDTVGATTFAHEAAELLRAAQEVGDVSRDPYVAINEGLLDADPQGVFIGLAQILAKDPQRWRRMELLLEHMPTDLNGASTEAMSEFILSLRDHLASQRALIPANMSPTQPPPTSGLDGYDAHHTLIPERPASR